MSDIMFNLSDIIIRHHYNYFGVAIFHAYFRIGLLFLEVMFLIGRPIYCRVKISLFHPSVLLWQLSDYAFSLIIDTLL